TTRRRSRTGSPVSRSAGASSARPAAMPSRTASSRCRSMRRPNSSRRGSLTLFKRVLHHDPIIGITEIFHGSEDGDSFTIETIQDVEPLLEKNKQDFNEV